MRSHATLISLTLNFAAPPFAGSFQGPAFFWLAGAGRNARSKWDDAIRADG